MYNNENLELYLYNARIEIVNEIIYLGLEFNESLNRKEFFLERFKKVEKRMYSLYNFGMKKDGLDPACKSFIYKNPF